MKFKAYIKYNFMQSREAKKFNDIKVAGDTLTFTLQDITGYYVQINGEKMFVSPSFTARELIIPWLQAGNTPELIEE